MKIQVAFDTSGAATAGVDREALVADLQAELDKLAETAGVDAPAPDKSSPPEGAQGDAAIIQWLLEVASDPAMAKAYAQGLLLAINSILNAAKGRESETADQSKEAEQSPPKKPVTVTIFGKEIGLPVATTVIKTFLENLQD